MFTGLVEALGTVHRLDREGAGRLLVVAEPTIATGVTVGDSVAINGACLTVVAHDAHTCSFQVGPETLRRTNIGTLSPGDSVNLERSLRVGDRLGGHFVQGHVDGLARISQIDRQGDWVLTWFGCDAEWTAQMVSKGSVAVDGISLTLVNVTADGFSVALIPHTLAKTTLGQKAVGDVVNLETDLLAKYVGKCLRGGGVTWDTLKQSGFVQ
jgi:riboflavin synthase